MIRPLFVLFLTVSASGLAGASGPLEASVAPGAPAGHGAAAAVALIDTGADTVLVLDTLPVLGSRVSQGLPLRTRSVQVLDRETLESLPARSVAEALRWASGVEVGARSPAQADLSIRGGSFEQLLVLVDGVRMSDPQTGHFDLDLTVPLDRVERIEILRGPASAQYGSDATGGVVNVVTRRTPSGVGARLEGGSFGTWTGALEATAPLPGGVLLEAAGEMGRSDGHRPGTEWEQLLGTARLVAPVAGGQLRGEGGLARRDFGADAFYAPFPSFEATRTETASLAWTPGPGARVRVEPRLTWRGHDDDFILIRENPSVYQNVHRSTQAGGDLTVRLAPLPELSVALGGEAARHGLDSNALGDRSETRAALFAEVAGRPTGAGWPLWIRDRLDLSLGLRHDDHAAWGGFTSPSVAAGWEALDGVRLRASWGRSFRGPTWTERYYADPGHIPNPDVRPEQGTTAEVGVQVAPEGVPGVSVSLAAFSRTNRDLIDWARPALPPGVTADSPAPWVPRNVNEARFRGVELEAAWAPGQATRLSVGGTLLSLRNDAEEGFESKYALRPLAEQLLVGVRQGLGGVEVSLRAMHGRRAGEGSFQEVDLRVEGRLPASALPGLSDDARLYLDLRNLLDADHPDLTSNPVPGRSVTLGLRVGLRPGLR